MIMGFMTKDSNYKHMQYIPQSQRVEPEEEGAGEVRAPLHLKAKTGVRGLGPVSTLEIPW